MSRAGSQYETAQINGIAHFIEHNIFKGGEKYQTPRVVNQEIDKYGGTCNAWTGKSEVAYFVKSAPEYTLNIMDVLADIIVHTRFPEPELEKEKGVVIQEIKMYEDMPRAVVEEKQNFRRYGDNNYGRLILGTEDHIKSFTQADLFAYKQGLYTKDNLIILVAGTFDQEKISKLIAEQFAALPSTKTITKASFIRQLPKTKQESFDQKTQQNHLIISAVAVDGKDERRHAAKILARILGGNMSSRLFQNVREKRGLCYYIHAEYEATPEYGDFFISAGIDKERFEFGREKIYAEIADLVAGNITQEEFTNAKTSLLGSLQMGIETSNQMVNFLGHQYLHYGEIETLEQKLENIRNVSLEQVCEVAQLLQEDQLYLYYLK